MSKRNFVPTAKDWDLVVSNTAMIIEDIAPNSIQLIKLLRHWRGIGAEENHVDGMFKLLEKNLSGINVFWSCYLGKSPTIHLTSHGKKRFGLTCHLNSDLPFKNTYIQNIYLYEPIDVKLHPTQIIYIDTLDSIAYKDNELIRDLAKLIGE